MFRAMGEPCEYPTETLCEWSVAAILKDQLTMLVPRGSWIMVLSALNDLVITEDRVGARCNDPLLDIHVASAMRSVLQWTTPKHHWPLVLSTLMKLVRVSLEGIPDRSEVY